MAFTKETKDDELYVYMNGKLIYKRWLKTGQSKVFDVMAYDAYTLESINENDRVVIASDVERDGIGIEVYRNDAGMLRKPLRPTFLLGEKLTIIKQAKQVISR